MQISVSELKKYLRCPRSLKLHQDGAMPESKILSYCQNIATKQVLEMLHSNGKKPHDYSKEDIASLCQKVWSAVTDDPLVNEDDLNSFVVQPKPATKTKPATEGVTKNQRMLDQIITWCFEYSRTEVDAEVIASNIAS